MTEPMKVAIPDQSFRTVPGWENSLALIPALDVHYLDLCLQDGRTQLGFADLYAGVPALAERISSATSRLGITTGVIDLTAHMEEIPGKAGAGLQTLALNHPDAAVRAESLEIYEMGLELAERLDVKIVSVPSGAFFDGESREDSIDRAIEENARRHEMAAARGIVFASETHVGSVFETIDECLRLGADVPGLKITLDPTNYSYLGNTDEEILRLVPLAGHVHVRGGRPGMAQVRFENSTVDYDVFADALVAGGYDGFLRLESVWRDQEDFLEDVDVVTEIVHYRDLLRRHGAR